MATSLNVEGNCPVCFGSYDDPESQSWIDCKKCNRWFHKACVSSQHAEDQLGEVNKWMCPRCEIESCGKICNNFLETVQEKIQEIPEVIQDDKLIVEEKEPVKSNFTSLSKTLSLDAYIDKMMKSLEREQIIDLPDFSGSLDIWPTFYDFYMDTESHYEPLENLDRLEKALKGKALEFVARELADRNLGKVMQKLNAYYGFDTLKRTVNDLQSIRVPAELNIEAVKRLRDQMSNDYCILKSLRADRYLSDPIITANLADKLPAETKTEWQRYVNEQLKIEYGGVSFEIFFKWFIQDTEWVLLVPEEAGGSTKSTKCICWFCKAQNHDLSSCSKFADLSVGKRVEFVRKHSVCFICLSHNYRKSSCTKKNKKCGKNNCKKNHHQLLHNDGEGKETKSKDEEIGFCEICQEHEKTRMCYPCGHLCVCDLCAGRLLAKLGDKLCPLCRNPFTEIVKVYI